MKKKTSFLLALPFLIWACNNESKDSVEKADSANEAKLDSPATHATITTDAETTDFLVKAANCGMAEVQFGQLAQEKAINQQVKDLGKMMADEHSAANEQVKSLAAQRNVSLPATLSDEKKKDYDNLAKKSGKDFDKAYLSLLESEHKTDIDLFEKSVDKINDAEVKTFINNTIPKLKSHHQSVKDLQKSIK